MANNYHSEPTRMDEYGYGSDVLDDKEKFHFGYSSAAGKDPSTARKKDSIRDHLDRLCTDVNYDVIMSKTFNFVFYAAYGSLFPFLGIYFKQLGLSPVQVGSLAGLRALVQIVATPFWGNVAERWRKWKLVLLASLMACVVFTISVAFVQPAARSCLVHNGTDVFLAEPYTVSHLTAADMIDVGEAAGNAMHAGRGRTRSKRSSRWLQVFDRMRRYNGKTRETEIVRRQEDQPVQFHVNVMYYPEGNDDDDNNNDKNDDGLANSNDDDNNDDDSDDNNNNNNNNDYENSRKFNFQRQPPLSSNGDDDNDDDDDAKIEEKEEEKVEEVDNHKPTKMTEEAIAERPISKAEVKPVEKMLKGNDVRFAYRLHQTFYQFRHNPFPGRDKAGLSPLPLDHHEIVNLDEVDVGDLVSPALSVVVYRLKDIRDVFLLLLFIQILGEFLSAPAVVMADTATVGYLGNDVNRYGNHRIYGCLGWSVVVLFVGIALDNSNVFANHPCGAQHPVERNYMTCFAVFSVFMSCSFLTATQFRFAESYVSSQTIPLAELRERAKDKVQTTISKRTRQDREQLIDDDDNDDDGDGDDKKVVAFDRTRITSATTTTTTTTTARNRSSESSESTEEEEEDHGEKKDSKKPNKTTRSHQIPAAAGSNLQGHAGSTLESSSPEPTPFVPSGRPGQPGTLPQWLTVLKMFFPIQCSSMVFVVWFVGFGGGLIFTFLLWHLQDLNGPPTLFGLSIAIQQVSEIIAHCVVGSAISQIGHVNIIYAGLIGNILRFIYISFLRNPWWILPFEFLQGLTEAAVWASAVSYVTNCVNDSSLTSTSQFILRFVYYSIGRGLGAIVGGALINGYGTQAVFRGYGITCIIVFALYFLLNYFYVHKLMTTHCNGVKGQQQQHQQQVLAAGARGSYGMQGPDAAVGETSHLTVRRGKGTMQADVTRSRQNSWVNEEDLKYGSTDRDCGCDDGYGYGRHDYDRDYWEVEKRTKETSYHGTGF